MLELVQPKVDVAMVSESYGRFVIEPLEPGFGTTLGNALRRVLLRALEGAAITSVKIDEVQHEFSTVPHVREDTTEFLLNVKGIRLRAFSDRSVQMRLEVTGEGVVTAGDIQVPADVEIVNPEHYLATLDSPDAHLSVMFNVERSKGYVPAGSREGLPLGVIPVDAIFTPIRKVNFAVEHTRVGQVSDCDRLILEIWTDGTIEPREALSQASQVLQRHLSLLTDLGRTAARAGERPAAGAAAIPSKVYDMPIEDLELSVRAYNCLKRSGITKVGQILEMDEDDLLAVRNFGRKSLDELKEKLSSRSLLQGSRLAQSMAAKEEQEALEEEGASAEIEDEDLAYGGTTDEEDEEADVAT